MLSAGVIAAILKRTCGVVVVMGFVAWGLASAAAAARGDWRAAVHGLGYAVLGPAIYGLCCSFDRVLVDWHGRMIRRIREREDRP